MGVEQLGLTVADAAGPDLEPEPDVADPDGSSALATPLPSTDDAVDLVLEWLAESGHGAWTLGNVSLQELDPPATGLLPIAVPGSPRLLALRCDAARGTAVGPAVASAARVIATLLAGEQERARLAERLLTAERESTIDSLTGLPNARAWWRHLSREAARCDRHDLCAGVLVIDLDELKETNDTAGHLAGDMLLRRAAGTLQACIRAGDFVARVGGDEFALLATDVTPGGIDALANQLRGTLAGESIAASIGAAVYVPGARINDVYHLADQAMYRAKRRRRSSAGDRVP